MPVRIVESSLGELTWHVASAVFPSAYAARQAWELVEHRVPRGSLGLYRHGPDEGGLRGCVVTVVSLDRAQVLRCVRLLRGGKDYPLDAVTTRALIARRTRVVLEYGSEGKSGRVKWRRPDERGANLTPEGEMREPGGEG